METRKVYGIFEKESGDLVYVGKTRTSSEQDLDDWEKHCILELEPRCNVRLWT